MILTLLLAAAQPSGPLPDPRTNYPAYAKYTDYQFQCDDRPYTKGCGNDRCTTRDYLALRCGGEGDAYEKDVLAEQGDTPEEVDRLVRAYRLAEVRRERRARNMRSINVTTGCRD